MVAYNGIKLYVSTRNKQHRSKTLFIDMERKMESSNMSLPCLKV